MPTLDLDLLQLQRGGHPAPAVRNAIYTKVKAAVEAKMPEPVASAQASAHELIGRMLAVTGN